MTAHAYAHARETPGPINMSLLVTKPQCQTILPPNDITVQAEGQTRERNTAEGFCKRLFLMPTTVFSSAVIVEPDRDGAEELRQNSEIVRVSGMHACNSFDHCKLC